MCSAGNDLAVKAYQAADWPVCAEPDGLQAPRRQHQLLLTSQLQHRQHSQMLLRPEDPHLSPLAAGMPVLCSAACSKSTCRAGMRSPVWVKTLLA